MIYLLAYDSFGNFNGFYSAYSSNKPSQYVKVDEQLHRYLISGDYVFKTPPYDVTRVLSMNDLHLFRARIFVSDHEPKDSTDLVKEKLVEIANENREEINQVAENLAKEKQVNIQQNFDIYCTQDAIDFLLFGMENDTISSRESVPMATSLSATPQSQNTGGSSMGAYFTTRIIKKGQISVEQGRAYYSQVKAQYPQYIDEVDFLLVSEGYENLIVK